MAGRTTGFQQQVYFLNLLAVSVATGLLITPAAHHRVLFRQSDKEGLLRRSNRLAALPGWWWIAVPLWQRAHNAQDRLRDEA